MKRVTRDDTLAELYTVPRDDTLEVTVARDPAAVAVALEYRRATDASKYTAATGSEYSAAIWGCFPVFYRRAADSKYRRDARDVTGPRDDTVKVTLTRDATGDATEVTQ
mgnify:CR=1 FL=1